MRPFSTKSKKCREFAATGAPVKVFAYGMEMSEHSGTGGQLSNQRAIKTRHPCVASACCSPRPQSDCWQANIDVKDASAIHWKRRTFPR